MTRRGSGFSIAHSHIDSDRFGILVARAWYPASAEDAATVTAFCQRERIALCIVRCWSDDLPVVARLNDQRFMLTDTLMTLGLALASPTGASNLLNVVRPAVPGEAEPLAAMARVAFHGYASHYHNNARLPRQAVDEIYPDWIRRAAVASNDDRPVLIVESNGEPAGFAALSVDAEDAAIELVAIHPSFRRLGCFRELLLACAAWARRKGAQRLGIATQLTNLPVHRVCHRLGFVPVSSTYTLHGWC